MTPFPISDGIFEIVRQDISLTSMPVEMEGIRVVQLSDLHRGSGKNFDIVIQSAINRANAIEPDYIFLTGDYVNQRRSDILPVVQLLTGLRAKCGIYAVLGNHDHRADPALIESALSAARIHVLNNRAIQLPGGLWLAGVDDILEGEGDLSIALSNVPDNEPLILLAHNPNIMQQIHPNREMVVLAGHTHAGQYHFPFLPPALICKLHLNTWYVQGWYRKNKASLYINGGIGVAGIGPTAFRYRCPSEITVFHLRKLEGA